MKHILHDLFHGTLRACELWWLLVMMVASNMILGIIAIPLASGFDHFSEKVQNQFAAFLHLATAHSEMSSAVILLSVVPATIGFSWTTFRKIRIRPLRFPGTKGTYEDLIAPPSGPTYRKKSGYGDYMTVQLLGISAVIVMVPLVILGGIFLVPTLLLTILLSVITSLIGLGRALIERQLLWVPLVLLALAIVALLLYKTMMATRSEE